MRIGIFAKTFAGSDPDTVLVAAREAGFDSVQYNLSCSGLESVPHHVPDRVAEQVAASARKAGVAIAALSGTVNLAHPDARYRADAVARLLAVIRAAAVMEVPLVTLCTGSRDAQDQWRAHADNSSPEAMADLRAALGPACAAAEALGLRLGIEPEAANVIRDAGAARRLIDDMQSPALAVVLDPANLFERPGTHDAIIAGAIDLLADRIALAHAKDRDAHGAFVAAGRGVVDFPDLIRRLRAAGFDGDLVTHGLTAEEAPAVARFLREAVA